MEGGLVWKCWGWKDGTKYAGLTKGGMMHSHGVLTFANKDRYEGMFEGGKMHGPGVYVWSSGMVYRGDWQQGFMHGCGTCVWKEAAAGVRAVEGKFFGDECVGDIMPCDSDNAVDSAVDADMAAFHARSFQWSENKQQQQQWQNHVRQQPAAPPQKVTAAAAATRREGRGRSSAIGSNKRAAGLQSADSRVSMDDQQMMHVAGLLQQLATDRVRVSSSKAEQMNHPSG